MLYLLGASGGGGEDGECGDGRSENPVQAQHRPPPDFSLFFL
jgi:hypothetical protein